jgi:hypothetical protein
MDLKALQGFRGFPPSILTQASQLLKDRLERLLTAFCAAFLCFGLRF